ncbi:non-ribosomal peptide synthetase, partial [Photorhabdus heterorhabditis]|uniref:non-ribosomal peptide synthetase n=1 Tax=Photorhabdus heterorhabditis TaxID=880156 RepID=UPI001561F034
DTCPAALRTAFNSVVARHEALRTTFFTDPQGRPAQRIAGALDVELPLVRVAPAAVHQRVSDFASAPFDLASGPLIRTCLVEDGVAAPLLVICTHHIVSDGWSEGVLTRELQQAYTAALRHEPAGLLPLPVQYADYALWQRERDLAPALAYWTEALADYEDGLTLPYDYPRPATRAWRAKRVNWQYPAELAREAAAFSRGHNATLFMTLVAALGLVLQRYTGRDDLCIGTTTAGRETQELEGLIGFFVNILPLRLDLSGTPDGSAVLHRVRQTVLDAFAHQALPFEHLLNALKRERDTGQVPLVPVVARHQNFRGASMGAMGARVEYAVDAGPRVITSELDIQFRGDGEGLEVWVEYAADLFSEGTVRRLLGHHQQLLTQLVSAEGPVAEYGLLTAGERAQFRKWQTPSRAPLAACVPALFEARVRQHPDAPACVSAAGTVSYDQLNRRANRLAHALRAAGVSRGCRVALCLPRTPDYLVALLGVLKADGCYVTLDPEYPAAYLGQIVKDAEPALIVTERSLAGMLPAGYRQLCAEDAGAGEASEENPASEAGPEDMAYIMYTSGSTGRPKGVQVPHRQVLNVLASLWRLMPLGEDEVVAHKTSAAFAVAVKELLSGLLVGRPVVFVAAETVKEGRAFAAALSAGDVTRLYIVPSHLESLLSEPEAVALLGGLRHCITAGEPLPASLARRVREALPGLQLW